MNVRHGLKRLPVWGLVLPLVLASAAMAALVTSAGITGDNPAVVQEPLTINAASAASKVVLSTGDSTELVIFNQDTSFAGAASTFPGDAYAIKMLLVNASNADVIQRLTIDAPDGFRFDVEGGDRVSVSQESASTFLIRVDKDADGTGTLTNDNTDTPETDEMRIKIDVGSEVIPGFYRVAMAMGQLITGELGG